MLNLTHTLDFTTTCTIGTSLVHSKLDYCKLTNWIVFNQSKTVLHEQSEQSEQLSRVDLCHLHNYRVGVMYNKTIDFVSRDYLLRVVYLY
mgnify:CR=1 FL=1